MNRLPKYKHSFRPYAVDLRSLAIKHEPSRAWLDSRDGEHWSREYWRLAIAAVWFRGPVGAPEPCTGTLSWSTITDPTMGLDKTDVEAVALAAVEQHTDGRYGGDCIAKLTPRGIWTADAHNAADIVLFEEELQLILDRFPEVPPGFDGMVDVPMNENLQSTELRDIAHFLTGLTELGKKHGIWLGEGDEMKARMRVEGGTDGAYRVIIIERQGSAANFYFHYTMRLPDGE